MVLWPLTGCGWVGTALDCFAGMPCEVALHSCIGLVWCARWGLHCAVSHMFPAKWCCGRLLVVDGWGPLSIALLACPVRWHCTAALAWFGVHVGVCTAPSHTCFQLNGVVAAYWLWMGGDRSRLLCWHAL